MEKLRKIIWWLQDNYVNIIFLVVIVAFIVGLQIVIYSMISLNPSPEDKIRTILWLHFFFTK